MATTGALKPCTTTWPAAGALTFETTALSFSFELLPREALYAHAVSGYEAFSDKFRVSATRCGAWTFSHRKSELMRQEPPKFDVTLVAFDSNQNLVQTRQHLGGYAKAVVSGRAALNDCSATVTKLNLV